MTRNHDTHSKWLGRIKPASQTKHYHLERFMIMKQTTTSRLRRSDENVMHTQNVLRILRTQKNAHPFPTFQRSDRTIRANQNRNKTEEHANIRKRTKRRERGGEDIHTPSKRDEILARTHRHRDAHLIHSCTHPKLCIENRQQNPKFVRGIFF